MRIFRRILYSLTQQKSKTILLFLSMFVCGNLLSCVLTISQASNQIKDDFLNSDGFRIKIMNPNGYENDFSIGDVFAQSFNKTIEIYDQILKQSSTLYGDYNLLFKGLQSEEMSYSKELILDEAADFTNIYLCGTQRSQMMPLENGIFQLIEGRSFNEEELKEGRRVMIVSSSFLKDGQPLSVGEKIKLKRNIYPLYQTSTMKDDVQYSEDVEYEVIGIFQSKEEILDVAETNSIDNEDARFYVPNQTITNETQRFSELNRQINQDERNSNYSYLLGDAYFKILNEGCYEQLIDTYPQLFGSSGGTPMLPSTYSITTTNNLYEKIAGPIESIKKLSSHLLNLSFILVFAIFSSIVFLVIKGRTIEMGIWLTLGEKKLNIILQLIAEVMIVGLLAFNLSVFTGHHIGNYFSQQFIAQAANRQSDILSEEEEKEQEKLIQSYYVDYDMEYIVKANGMGIICMVLSSGLPVYFVLKKKPKQILLG